MLPIRSSALALAGLLVAAPALAQDQDADGVLDAADTYPCNPTFAGEAFGPAEGVYGTLLFEDEWPDAGDQDLNDLVLDYNYVVQTDAQGRAVRITARYHVAALGGVTPLGLGLHLPVPASAVGAASITDANGSRGLPTVANDAEATFYVSTDLTTLFGAQALPFNVKAGAPAVASESIVVQIDLATPTTVAMSASPFDVFVFRVTEVNRETHLPGYGGTSRMNPSLFGTSADNSAPGRNFVDTAGLPFVLDVPSSADYPLEETHVAQLWPNITTYATSGGVNAKDFYTTSQDSFRFTARATAPAIPATNPDISCVPAGNYPDPAGFNNLWHVATDGSDSTGDGSANAPFASLHVAISAAASGDGIQIHPGTYRLVPQVHYSGYMTAGIYDQRKRLHIFGANDQTILEVHSSDASLRDSHVLSFKAQENINGTIYGSVLSNVTVHFWPNRSTNYSNAIVGWNSNGAEIHNVVFENKSTTHNWAYIYDNGNPYDTPRIFNSVFISNGRWWSRYTGRPTFVNCVLENRPNAYSIYKNNVVRRATAADLLPGTVASDLNQAGDPAITNPDGTRSHVGVRGGRFAWP